MAEAKRTVTDVRSWSYEELLAALGIAPEDGKRFTEIIVNVQQLDKGRGRLTLITKTEGALA